MPKTKPARAGTTTSRGRLVAKPKGSKPKSTSVARRRAARRRTSARRRTGRVSVTSKKNQLVVLDQNTAELRGDIQAIKTPADKAHNAIEKVKAPLLLPGQIKAKVQRVKTVAKGLDSLARLASIIPGPIGVGAKGLHRALVPLIGKRGAPGVLDQVLSALTRVDRALKPVVTKLNQVERPIDAARDFGRPMEIALGAEKIPARFPCSGSFLRSPAPGTSAFILVAPHPSCPARCARPRRSSL